MDRDDQAPPPALPPIDPSAAGAVPASSLTPELLASLLADGDDELAAWTLRHALAEMPRARVFDTLVADAMRLVGDRWLSGEWSIADEHFASQTLTRALDAIRPAGGPSTRIGPLAVLAAPSGEHHQLGLICLEQCLVEAGWQVANLGADVPASDLGGFVAERRPAMVALAATSADRAAEALRGIGAVRAVDPAIPIALGGRLGGTPGARDTFGVSWAGTTIEGLLAYAASIRG
jgi:methanogenic corrinoid protein MtbC1